MSNFLKQMENAKSTYLENDAKNLNEKERVSISQAVDRISDYIKKELIDTLKQGRVQTRETSVGAIFHKTIYVKYVSASVQVRFDEAKINTIRYYTGGDECSPYFDVTVKSVKEVQQIIDTLNNKLRCEKIVCDRKESNLSCLGYAKSVYQVNTIYLLYYFDIE